MTSLLERNLEHSDPLLAARIRRAVSDVKVLPTVSGHPTARIIGEEGDEVFLHDSRDPAADTRLNPGHPDAVVVVGLGLGYAALDAIRRVSSRTWILVVEPCDDILRAAFENVDLVPVLSRERVRFLTGELGQIRSGFRAWILESQAADYYLFSNAGLERARKSVYGPVLRVLGEELNRRRTEVATLVENSERMVRNRWANLPVTIRSAAWKSFEGRLARVPGIVVASGPSLEKQADAFRSARERAVFVVASKSLRWLLAHDIVPEFVCHLDVAPESAACLSGFDVPREVTLVWEPECAPEAVRGYSGDRVTYDAAPGEEAGWESKGAGGRGLSVAHMAFLFARALGADPIALVGVDLAIPGERTHAEGVTMTWGGSVEPLLGAAVEIPAARGGTVRSIPAFRAMVTLFEEELGRTAARVVNTSEIGARIRGTEPGTLESVLGSPVDVRGPIGAALAEPRPFDPAVFEASVVRWLAAIDRVDRAASEGLRALAVASRESGRATFSASAVEVNRHRQSIAAEAEMESRMRRLLAPEAVVVQELNRRVEGASPQDRFLLDVERTAVFFRGYRRAAGVLRECVTAARREILR